MKLGTETNSLVNALYSSPSASSTPAVGDGATILHWTDRSAATVVAVERDLVFTTNDTATRVDDNGMSEIQRYQFTSNLHGPRDAWRKNRKGAWCQVRQNDKGRWVFTHGTGIVFGRRNHYHDFSF